MLFAITKLYILYKIDKDLSLFFIVCGGGDGRWWAYSNCHSGVSQLEDGRTAVAVRCRNACCSLLEACSGYVHNALKKDKLTFQKLFYTCWRN